MSTILVRLFYLQCCSSVCSSFKKAPNEKKNQNAVKSCCPIKLWSYKLRLTHDVHIQTDMVYWINKHTTRHRDERETSVWNRWHFFIWFQFVAFKFFMYFNRDAQSTWLFYSVRYSTRKHQYCSVRILKWLKIMWLFVCNQFYSLQIMILISYTFSNLIILFFNWIKI